MSHHRRSDATDETHNKGSLLSRMTKDGKPVAPVRSLASRITRDPDSDSSYGGGSGYDGTAAYGRDLSEDQEPSYSRKPFRGRGARRTQDSNHGRLKDDDSAPREESFQEPTSRHIDLVQDRWVKDGGGDRRSSNRDRGGNTGGFNIRGSAAMVEGFSIRGAAGD